MGLVTELVESIEEFSKWHELRAKRHHYQQSEATQALISAIRKDANVALQSESSFDNRTAADLLLDYDNARTEIQPFPEVITDATIIDLPLRHYLRCLPAIEEQCDKFAGDWWRCLVYGRQLSRGERPIPLSRDTILPEAVSWASQAEIRKLSPQLHSLDLPEATARGDAQAAMRLVRDAFDNLGGEEFGLAISLF